ncbi:MAG: hypothetical protein EZS28_010623, partial [Streblomastix strix]
DIEKDSPTCICAEGNEDSITPGSCYCGKDHHPPGCICSSSSDSGCICSTTIDSNPPSCSIQDCSSSFGESVTIDSCYCTKTNYPTGCKLGSCKGIVDYPQCLCSGVDNEPETCTLNVCKSSSQQYPCICTGTPVDTPNCICSQQNEETLPSEGSCMCGLGHHPSGCICSSSSDSGCICSSTLATNPSSCTVIDCKVDSDRTVTKDSCVCTGTKHPLQCQCPDDSSKLTDIPKERCYCRNTADPRANGICPAYCSGQNTPDSSCVCDTNPDPDTGYDLTDCRETKICIGNNNPQGCSCPSNDDIAYGKTKCDEYKNYLKEINCTEVNYVNVGVQCPVIRVCEAGDDLITPCNCSSAFHESGCACNSAYPYHGCSCNMKAGGIYPLDYGLICMRSIPLTSNEKSITINLLKEYLNSYAFLDTSLNPTGSPIGYGKHAVDIIGSLNSISANISYNNTFDFYESIMILLNNLKDPHTIFTPPCVSKFNYLFFNFKVNQNQTDKTFYITIKSNGNDYIVDKINIKGLPIYDPNDNSSINEGTYPALEAIAKWADEEVSISRNPITRMNYALMDKSSPDYAKRLLIDVRGNGGGQVRLGRQLLNFLFPNVGHPLYQTVDMTRTDLNEQLAKITLYESEHLPDEAQLPLELDEMEIDKLFYSRGNRKRTTQFEGKNSLTVNLTYKYMNYMGNNDIFVERTNDWSLHRKILYQPQDVLIVTDGACASTCSQFVKHIGEKHLGRIVGVGAPYPINQDIRFDVGMATSGSVYNYKSVQEIKSNASLIESAKIDESKLPNKFYRIGTGLSWSNKGGYGFTDETSDQLLEYKIVDADFRVEYFPFDSLISDKDEQRFALYDEVLKREKELLGNVNQQSSSYISVSNNYQIHKSNSEARSSSKSKSKSCSNSLTISNSDPNKCLSWEVETDNTQTPSNCKGCLRNDPYSIYGHPCSVRGSSEAKGRYSNGTAKIGEYLTDKCIFSHCKVGYYRKNIVIGQKMDQKCSLVPLGPYQDRSEITPDQTEDTEIVSNQCDMLVIVDEQVEQEEGEQEEQQQSDQDKQKEIETEEPKSKAEMISGIVVAGVIVVASIVAMIIVAVVIQHQKYSGLGRRGQQLISVDA